MLKDLGIEEPQRVMVPQGRASLEAMGSNSPVAVESKGNSGQFKSADLTADFEPEAPCSLQAVKATELIKASAKAPAAQKALE